jgi:23S rRNA (uracil1939-C5)-methyltransferase
MKPRKSKNNTKNRKPAPPISITIDHIGSMGDGVGVYKNRPVYVGKTAPGDVVSVQIESGREDGFFARLLNVETPGPARAVPPCPNYAPDSKNCGGCALQHITTESYRAWKIAKVKNALERGGAMPEQWEVPIFLPHATRRRATFTAHKINNDITMGYNAPRSHSIVDIQDCMVLEPTLNAMAQMLRPYLSSLLPEGRAVDIMLQNVDGVFDMILTGEYQSRGKFTYDQDDAFASIMRETGIARISHRARDFAVPEIILQQKPVAKKYGTINVELPPGAFLQASMAGEAALAAAVKKYAGDSKNIADLFCGTGLFAGNLAAPNFRIYAADGEKPAIAALKKSAENIKNFTTEHRDLFKNPPGAAELSKFDCVIFDPPRAGAKALSESMAQSDIPAIIAVSCNPITFARDAAILMRGGYGLRSVTIIDQFVWSAHVEIVGLLTRPKSF